MDITIEDVAVTEDYTEVYSDYAEDEQETSSENGEGYVTVTYEQMLQIREELIAQYDKIQEEKARQEKVLEDIKAEKAEQQKVYEKFITEKTAFNEDMKALNAKVLAERKRLKEENMFFEKKMQILQNGFMQLDLDRKKLERDRAELESKTVRASEDTRVGGVFNASQFFIGVNSALTARKRYKDLLKIFHPDNLCGDETIVKAINDEYSRLRDNLD